MLFDVFDGNNNGLRIIMGLSLALLLAIVAYLFYVIRLRDTLEAVKINENDERYRRIKEKSGLVSFYSVIIVTLIIMFVSSIYDYTVISYGASGVLLGIILIYYICIVYLDKKM